MTLQERQGIYNHVVNILGQALDKQVFDLLVQAINEDEKTEFYDTLTLLQRSNVVIPGKVVDRVPGTSLAIRDKTK